MLITFTLENWSSFKESVTFSMVASRERQHGDRVPHITKYGTKILPIAALFGGNASGKSNFFNAFRFAKHLVVKGTQPDSLIAVETFLLDHHYSQKPTRFVFEFLINKTIYEYSFSLTNKAILEEKLVEIRAKNEFILFHRKENKIEFFDSLRNDQFLKFVFQGTRDNQLFITNSVSQKVKIFYPIYHWFKNILHLLTPHSQPQLSGQFFDSQHPSYKAMTLLLEQLDTGIIGIGKENVEIEHLSLPENIKNIFFEGINEGEIVITNLLGSRHIVKRENGIIQAWRLVTYHKSSNGATTTFDFEQESDGSQRVIDLLPAFLALSEPDAQHVFVIDELDRSLHTLLTQFLLESYLKQSTKNSRSQLLFTTHDVLLMNQNILRRDEMWVVERNPEGASQLWSFSDFKNVRYDKDLRKSYLQGRLGGIPKIHSNKSLFNNYLQ